MSDWISVEDRLPQEDCMVDVWIPESEYDYKRATDIHFKADSGIFHIDYDLTDITDDVSHWMPLPQKPE